MKAIKAVRIVAFLDRLPDFREKTAQPVVTKGSGPKLPVHQIAIMPRLRSIFRAILFIWIDAASAFPSVFFTTSIRLLVISLVSVSDNDYLYPLSDTVNRR